MAFKTIAYQNERPGLITLIGYIGLVYGFLADTFYLKETYTGLELFSVILILIINVIVICAKPNSEEENIENNENKEKEEKEEKD